MPLWRGLGRGCTSPSSRHLVIRVFSLFCCHGKISLLSADLEGMLPALTALPPPLSNPITSAICEQHRGLCQASKSQVKLNKWERRKKRSLFSILGDTLHPSKAIGDGDLLAGSLCSLTISAKSYCHFQSWPWPLSLSLPPPFHNFNSSLFLLMASSRLPNKAWYNIPYFGIDQIGYGLILISLLLSFYIS